MRRGSLVAALACGLWSCFQPNPEREAAPVTQGEARSEQYNVWRSVIEQGFLQPWSSTVVIRATAVAVRDPQRVAGLEPFLANALQNGPPVGLTADFGLSVPVVLLDERAEARAFECAGTAGQDSFSGLPDERWYCFFASHPDATGLLSLSIVAFDRDAAVAYVFATHECSTVCGSGGLYRLERIGGRWEVVEVTHRWQPPRPFTVP